MRKLLLYSSFLITLLIISCSKPRQLINKKETYSYECIDIVSFAKPDTLTTSEVKADTFLTGKYTDNELLVVNAFGLYHELLNYERQRILVESDSLNSELLLSFLRSASRLTEGTTLAQLEVQSVVDLIDCSIINLRKNKSIISSANLKSQNRLSNWAIVVGAATTIATAVILTTNDEELITSSVFDWLAIPGGIAAGYLAIKSANVDKKLRLNPLNNLIYSVWYNENHHDAFPATIWHLMNLPVTINGIEQSLRESIIQDWKTSESMLGNADNNEILEILLADEGIYNESMIDLRIEMLETLGTGIDQINRQLYIFNAKRY